VIDLYSTGILDSRDEKTRKLLVPDDIHPNDAGNEILANEIAAELCLYYTK
jgi:lysophospholipase L1-like esterase